MYLDEEPFEAEPAGYGQIRYTAGSAVVEIGSRTKLCLGLATVVVSAGFTSYAWFVDLPEDSILELVGIQVSVAGLVPGLFVVWVALRSDAGSNAARRQTEVLPAEGNRDVPFDQPAFSMPGAVIPLAAILICSLAPAMGLVYVPFLVFFEDWWLAPLLLLLGVNSIISIRDCLRLVKIAYGEAAHPSPPAV